MRIGMRRWWVAAAAMALLAAMAVSGGNAALFLHINGAAMWLPDVAWSCLTVPGDTLVALVLLLALARQRPAWVMATLAAALPATLLTHGLKHWVPVYRPAAVLHDAVHVIGPVLHRGSFPSGHTATAFVLATVVIAGLRATGPSLAVAALALLVGLSRIAVGAHWPVDVAAGMLIGWLSGLIGLRAARAWHDRPLPLAVQMLLVGCAAWLLVGYDSRYPLALVFEKLLAAGALAIYLQPLATGWYRARAAMRLAQAQPD
jgi:membrane-associated phospholipid phosphatase